MFAFLFDYSELCYISHALTILDFDYFYLICFGSFVVFNLVDFMETVLFFDDLVEHGVPFLFTSFD
jgi:hypothetical protein